jgi:hypothetical protein
MRRAAFLVALFSLAGCEHYQVLAPAPGAERVSGDEDAAASSADGVRLVAQGRWSGHPSDLAEVVTPVRVTIENHSASRLSLRYRAFSLRGPSGQLAGALSPASIQRPEGANPAMPMPFGRAYSAGVYSAPIMGPGPLYANWDPCPDSTGYGWPYYGDCVNYWEPALPTPDMLRKALPEGVLEPGSRRAGYLYFPRVSSGEGSEARFEFELVDADSKATLGSIVVPFVVKRG